ncbi:MAG: MipA/OmpV family protein [Psychrobium sp.]
MKVMTIKLVGLGLCGLLLPAQAAEQSTSEMSLGVGAFYSKSPYAKWDGDEVTPFPYFTFKKGNFYMDGTGVGYTLMSHEKSDSGFYLDAVASTQIGIGYKSEDSVALAGMKDRNDIAVELGAKVGYYNNFGLLELTLLQDVAGAHEGFIGHVTYSLPLGSEAAGFQFVPYLKATYSGDKYNNYYFGVEQNEATTSREFYRAKAGVDTALGLNIINEFSERWSIAINAEYKQLSDEAKRSPIVARDNIFSGFVGVNYSF